MWWSRIHTIEETLISNLRQLCAFNIIISKLTANGTYRTMGLGTLLQTNDLGRLAPTSVLSQMLVKLGVVVSVGPLLLLNKYG